MKRMFSPSWLRVIGLCFLPLAMLLSGCGGGSSSSPPPADPTGYYGVSGFATVKQSDNITDLSISSGLEAMVYNNRILMLSSADKLLYDITITNISGDSFTGTAVIYTDNQNPMNATVSGTITSGSSITGTLTGTGAGNGTFKLVYESKGIAPIMTTGWGVKIGGSSQYFNIQIDASRNLTTQNGVNTGYFSGCTISGNLVSIGGTQLYSVKSTISGCTTDASFNGTYNGMATSQDAASIILVFAVMKADASHSLSADFSQ
ncbi:MAG: hypothetical protein GC149_18680 [Gammaproteobacteria bacterium]|nr:hypothetical protein [Gammaproteobacteria bacterium]